MRKALLLAILALVASPGCMWISLRLRPLAIATRVAAGDFDGDGREHACHIAEFAAGSDSPVGPGNRLRANSTCRQVSRDWSASRQLGSL